MEYLIIDKEKVFIDCNVIINENAVIYPFCTLIGKTVIGKNAVIYPGSVVKDSYIGDNTVVKSSYVDNSQIGKDCEIGPFANIKEHSNLCDNVRIGAFVEVKNSVVNEKTKAAHLSYIGDALIGKECNVGCGVVFCNYDGKKKHNAVVGDKAFIGSNSNLIAPVKVGDNSYIAAGSTVTENVDAYELYIERGKEKHIPLGAEGRYKND